MRSSLVLKYVGIWKKPFRELARLKKIAICGTVSKQITRKWCRFAILTSCQARTSDFIYVIRSYDEKKDRLLTKCFFIKYINMHTTYFLLVVVVIITITSLKSKSGFCIFVASPYNAMGQ